MKKISDKIVTGFFVLVFGVLWYFSTKCYVKPDKYNIVIYDLFGEEQKLDGIRTSFKTIEVATSFLNEYKKNIPHYEFSIAESIPEIKRRTIFSRILRSQR